MPDPAKSEPNSLQAEPILEGINEIITTHFTLKCLQTNTGMKFMHTFGVDRIKEQEVILKQLYEVYADYVGKNPF